MEMKPNICFTILLTLVGSIFVVILDARDDKFYAIANMANNKDIVRWSLKMGANALKVDVNFDKDGKPANSGTNKICDCNCYPSYKPEVCNTFKRICSFKTKQETKKELRGFFRFLAKQKRVALIYVDSQLEDVDANNYKTAGEKIVKFMNETLIKKNYKGKIVVTGSSQTYMNAVTNTMKNYKHIRGKVYIATNGRSPYTEEIKYLAELSYTRKIYSIVKSPCSNTSVSSKYDETKIASVNKARGVLSDVIAGTLDTETEFDKYHQGGARGIVTNNITQLIKWVKDRDIKLYRPKDHPYETTHGNHSFVTELGNCTCSLNGTGCIIESAASAYSACKCTYYNIFLFEGCNAEVVGCLRSGGKCSKPDTSYKSCLLGSGNCGGYKEEKCSCTVKGRGCVIDSRAPQNKACKCEFVDNPWWKFSPDVCNAEVVNCPSSAPKCSSPDETYESCQLGKGNCDGYN